MRRISIAFFGLSLVGGLLGAASAGAQQPSRQLAPGVLTVIPVEAEEEELATGPIALPEIPGKDWMPELTAKSDTIFERAKLITLRRGVWNLEFAFKPLRTITVDVPQASGRMERKLIWYLVYRVKNVGYHMEPDPKIDSFGHTTYEVKEVNRSVRFFPSFILETHDLDQNTSYLDRVIPAAIDPIREKEKIDTPLYHSANISQQNIPWSEPPADESVWGVAMWEDVDPRVDFLSIFVKGLTNAYDYRQDTDPAVPGEPPSRFKMKTLQLNFWRPSDDRNEDAEIRYGVPKSADQADFSFFVFD
jgi:hypothetical protein